MAIVLQQVIKMMHTQQIMLAERAHDKTAGKIGDAEAQDAKTGQQADDASRQENALGNDIRLILAEHITDASQDNRVIADVEVDEGRDDVEPPCRINLPGEILRCNPLDIDCTERGHQQGGSQRNRKVQPAARRQHATDERIVWLTLLGRKRDAVLLQIRSTAPGIRHTMTQRRRKAAVHKFHKAADTDEHIPEA